MIVLQRAQAENEKLGLFEKQVREMFIPQQGRCGLGIFLQGQGPRRRFFHEGRNDGFDALMVGTVETGQGAIVMINCNDNASTCGVIIREIARQYRWP